MSEHSMVLLVTFLIKLSSSKINLEYALMSTDFKMPSFLGRASLLVRATYLKVGSHQTCAVGHSLGMTISFHLFSFIWSRFVKQ